MKLIVTKLPPLGLQLSINSRKRTLIATTLGRINQVNDLDRFSFGIGWNLKPLQTYQLYKRF